MNLCYINIRYHEATDDDALDSADFGLSSLDAKRMQPQNFNVNYEQVEGRPLKHAPHATGYSWILFKLK